MGQTKWIDAFAFSPLVVATAFARQLFLSMIAQALIVKSAVEIQRSQNTWGTLLWQVCVPFYFNWGDRCFQVCRDEVCKDQVHLPYLNATTWASHEFLYNPTAHDPPSTMTCPFLYYPPNGIHYESVLLAIIFNFLCS